MKIKKIFVINLDRRPEKLKVFNEKYPLDRSILERVPAVDGLNLPFHEEPLKSAVRLGDRFNPFMVGVTLSNYKIFKSVIENEEYSDEDAFITFEDDVFYANHFLDGMKALEEFNEPFDMISIGGRWRPNFVPSAQNLQRFWRRATPHLFEYDTTGDRYRGGWDFDRGAFSMLWTKGFARRLLKHLTSRIIVEDAIDNIIGKFWFIEKSKVYDFFPHICFSPADYNSDIQHKKAITVTEKELKIENEESNNG